MNQDRFFGKFEGKRTTGILSVGIKYSSPDLICDITSYRARICSIGKESVCDKIVTENLKREKRWKSRNFLTRISV